MEIPLNLFQFSEITYFACLFDLIFPFYRSYSFPNEPADPLEHGTTSSRRFAWRTHFVS